VYRSRGWLYLRGAQNCSTAYGQANNARVDDFKLALLTAVQNINCTNSIGCKEHQFRASVLQPRALKSIAMKSLMNRFAKDESGATAIEYGLIATLIGVAIILGAAALGTQLNSVFQGISTKLVAP
jgi:pilus assembly protein Flp/PilA